MKYEQLLNIEKKLVNEKRYNHIIGVVNTSQMLAKLYCVDYNKCSVAAIFHDWCKDWPIEKLQNYLELNNLEYEKSIPLIFHGIVSSHLNNQQYKNLFCFEIKEAILYHTTLNSNVSEVAKILFIADYIEPSRSGKHYDKIRKLIGNKSLDYICYQIILQIQQYLTSISQSISINSLKFVKEYQENENICIF